MKKVLIYIKKSELKPKGGPSGYLYNLKAGLESINDSEIEIEFLKESKPTLEENTKLKNLIPNRIKDIRRALKYSNYLTRNNEYDVSFLEYDAIHFHKTEDLYMNRNVLKDYKGKIILTSHTPCAPFKELIARLNSFDYNILKNKIDKLEEMDVYAFEKADYIIFPCRDAEEPYFNTWNKYKDIRCESKINYLPTGIVGCKSKVNRKSIRDKYGIPQNAFLVSYVGRHNEIKGYGDLKEIGKKILENKDVYFLIAGKEGPLFKLENERWIEVGWTNDPHSIIAAADLFILPNKETYFDLVLLEILSLGVPVLLSRTGGNKYFEHFKCDGIFFYDDVDNAIEQLEFIINNQNTLRGTGLKEKELFESNFTINIFAKNYVKLLNNMLGE